MIRIAIASASFLGLAAAAGTPPQDASAAPPGLVLVHGGRTVVGSDEENVEPFILRMREAAPSLAAETPKNKVEVDDFYLMVSEVTNEQYARYVTATGVKPPYTWGGQALTDARSAFLEEEGKRRKEALDKGERVEGRVFDAQKWWDKNWRDHPWKVPEDALDQPVVFVTYGDAAGYAAWAGLRLMTEFEYARAARGDADRVYPWGDDWKPGMAATRQAGRDKASPVGSFPDGAVNGVYDLCANVWEWTSSPMVEFKDYKPLRVKTGKSRHDETLDVLGVFDSDYRVCVGGSYANDEVAARISTRRGTDRSQATEAVGFRCAASTVAGLDEANHVIADTIKLNVLPADQDIEFYPAGAVVKQRWRTTKGTAKVPGYQVIDGYDHAIFVPVLKAPVANAKDLRDLSVKGMPMVLGFLSISEPILEPALPAGTYLVAFRGAGDLPKKPKAEEKAQQEELPKEPEGFAAWASAPGLKTDEDSLIFFTADGKPVAAMPAGQVTDDQMRQSSSVGVLAFVPPTEKPKKGAPPVTPMDTLLFHLGVANKYKSKGVWFNMPLKVAPDTILKW